MSLDILFDKSKEFTISQEIIDNSEKARLSFVSKFPLNELNDLSIDQYVQGTDDNSFCYWLEFNKKIPFGIGGGNASKFGIYKAKDGTYCTGQGKNKKQLSGSELNKIFSIIKLGINQALEYTANDQIDKIKAIDLPLWNMVLQKILLIYYPDKFLTIGSADVLIECARDINLEDVALNNENSIQINFECNKTLRSLSIFKDWPNPKLGFFIWDIYKKDSLTKNYRQEFTNWLTSKYGDTNGTTSSYIKAIDILTILLSKDLFKTNDDTYLESLYQDLKKEQKIPNGKYYYAEAPSYGFNGFYSSSIKSYRDFLKSLNQTQTTVIDDRISFPLNTIFYGPPGTGKTYNTVLRAAEIVMNQNIDSYDEALKIFKDNLHDQIEFITFHQNYSYEDFIQGLRPDTENNRELTFERKDGVFKIIADRALQNLKESEQPTVTKKTFDEAFNELVNPLVEEEVEGIEVQMKKVSYFITAFTNKSIDFRKDSGGTGHTLSISTLRKMYDAESLLDIHGLTIYYSPLLDKLLKIGKDSSGKKNIVQRKNYVIIIDEINRANISRVFGELITLIEPDKRSHGTIPLEARLPSGDSFIVPSNLFIIGTMNTADKSIALLDIALRRRFEFESLYPKYEIQGQEIYDVGILQKINEQIIKSKGHDFQIGHAYFMGENRNLIERMNKKVIPLLLEYYMNDEKEVKGILQSAGLIIEENAWPLRITGTND